MASIYLWSSIC